MKKLIFLLISLIVTHSVCCAYDDVFDVEVGETFTVNGGSYIYVQAVLWDYDPAIFDAVSVSGYSTTGTFKAIKPSPSVGTVIQATIYYYQDGTTSTGLNKAVASWKVYVADDGSGSTVSLPVSMEMEVNEVRTVSATTSNPNYSGGFRWNTEPSIVEIISQDGNTAQLRANSPGKVFIYVTLDNSNYDRMLVSVSKSSGGGSNPGTEMNAQVVDLGLSVKWATCNLGASSPTEYGYNYGWGSINPNAPSTPASRGWTSIDELEYHGVIKDGHFTPEYDACTRNLGIGYRVPTVNEWQELFDNCTWESFRINGEYCIKGTSKKTGESITFPCSYIRSLGAPNETRDFASWSCSCSTIEGMEGIWGYYVFKRVNFSGQMDSPILMLDQMHERLSLRAVFESTSDIEDCIDTDEYPIEYYDLQGLPIQNPCKGQLVIKKQGATVLKIIYNGD